MDIRVKIASTQDSDPSCQFRFKTERNKSLNTNSAYESIISGLIFNFSPPSLYYLATACNLAGFYANGC
jgi:hypothetical protein